MKIRRGRRFGGKSIRDDGSEKSDESGGSDKSDKSDAKGAALANAGRNCARSAACCGEVWEAQIPPAAQVVDLLLPGGEPPAQFKREQRSDGFLDRKTEKQKEED